MASNSSNCETLVSIVYPLQGQGPQQTVALETKDPNSKRSMTTKKREQDTKECNDNKDRDPSAIDLMYATG